ncbi:type II secretion system protein [Vibrio sp. PNB22_3_1]
MTKCKRQLGLTLVEMALAISLVSILAVGFIQFSQSLARDASAQVIKSRVEFVMDAIDRYYINQVTVNGLPSIDINAFPINTAALVAQGALPQCLAADQANGFCIDYSFIPFTSVAPGAPILFNRFLDPLSGEPFIDVQFDLSLVSNIDLRLSTIAALSAVPGFTINAADFVSIRVPRPGALAQLDVFVHRDGSRQMLGDWDAGNVNIQLGGVLQSNDVTAVSNGGVGGNISADGWLDVTGQVNARGGLQVTGTSRHDGLLDANAGADIEGGANIAGLVELQNDLAVAGGTSLGGNLNLNGNSLDNVDYIFNLRDAEIQGLNDRTLTSGLRATGSLLFNGAGSTRSVTKPSCPPSYTPKIELWTISLGYANLLPFPSNTQLGKYDMGTYWNIYFGVTVVEDLTTTPPVYGTRHEGVIGYTTWCGH